MEDENTGAEATSEPQVEETTEQTPEETPEENVEEVKARLSKAEELANNYKIRAEKAEKEARAKPKEEVKPSNDLTSKDVLTLANEGITNEDDVEFAEKWARFSNKPVREAIKDDTFKAVLAKQQEERKTASATQTKGGAKGFGKVTGDDLLAKAKRGQYPESEEDMEKMIVAKFDAKKRK